MIPWVNQEARVSYIGGDAETSNFSTAGLQGMLKQLGGVLCGPPYSFYFSLVLYIA